MAIDARLRHGEAGGVESVIVGLAEGLSRLEGAEEYYFLTLSGDDDWIRPHLGGRLKPVPIRAPASLGTPGVRRIVKTIPGVRSAVRALRLGRQSGPPESDGTIERLGIDLVHMTQQWGFLTRIPSIYHPHDLQHRHLPALFDPLESSARDRWYSLLARRAAVVAVASSWTKDDVIRQLGVIPERVHVVPWAPPLQAATRTTHDDIVRQGAGLGLPSRYLLYSAQTWPHKNHVGLLEALAMARDRRGVEMHVAFSGRRNDFASVIDRRARDLKLTDSVTWLGFLGPDHLMAVLAGATAAVIPSRFEAASGPLWEAFAAGVPAACSNVTSLPMQAGAAALIFDPERPAEIADALVKLWTDDRLRTTLAARGRAQVAQFTWERTAQHFRALYRLVGGRDLSIDDQRTLDAPAAI